MSTVTTRLNLVKPATPEQFSLATLNNNMDLIDAKVPFINGQKPFGHMGRSSGFQAFPASALTAIGMDVSSFTRGGVTFDAINDFLIVPTTGWYRVSAQCYFSGGPGTYVIGIIAQSGSVSRQVGRFSAAPVTIDTTGHISTIVSAAAGDKFQLQGQVPSGGQSAWGGNGNDGCWVQIEWVDS